MKQAGRTIILTTHYMEEAERLCDRVAIMDHGKVIAMGTPKQLIATVGGEDIVEFAVAVRDGRRDVRGKCRAADWRFRACNRIAWMQGCISFR